MKSLRKITSRLPELLLLALFLASGPSAMSSTTWYVDGVNGNDNNDCLSAQTACQTIGHAISLAKSSDVITVAPATYMENLTIAKSLKVIGSDAKTTVIDGGGVNTVVTISGVRAHVTLSKLTIQHGFSNTQDGGGGVLNYGTLTINNCTLSENISSYGGGISTYGTLTINNSTLSGNSATYGGGVLNSGDSTLTINNSTLSGNSGGLRGGGGGIYNYDKVTLQNSILSNNGTGGNCGGHTMTSKGYNLSSDRTCHFYKPGDLNKTIPMLGPLQNNGGPTQTKALLARSPAIDAGNPNGCTDGKGHLLKTDQRGKPRPDHEDMRCDMGAFEQQTH